MRWYLSHAAMLLLGLTLTVGFYEGRRLVKNTARALGAGGAVSSASARRDETEELRERLAEAEEKLATRRATRSERSSDEPRPRRRRGGGGDDDDPSAMSRAERLQMIRERRERLGTERPPLAVRPTPDGELPPPAPLGEGLEEPELVDTGLPPP